MYVSFLRHHHRSLLLYQTPTRRPTRYSRPRDLITPIAPLVLDQQHSRPVPSQLHLSRNTSGSRLRTAELKASDLRSSSGSTSPSPPLSPERTPSAAMTSPTLRRGSSGGKLRGGEVISPGMLDFWIMLLLITSFFFFL